MKNNNKSFALLRSRHLRGVRQSLTPRTVEELPANFHLLRSPPGHHPRWFLGKVQNFSNKLLLLLIFLAFFLRFFKLAFYPPGLYSDEAALGYNAYSVLKTGRDEFGKLFPLTFRSFGDYKPPLSVYLMIPSIFVFGLNEFAVRFPFALFGSFSILLIYFLSLRIFEEEKGRELIALLAACLLAISPWHLHQARSAMLVGIEVFFNALGVFLFLKGLKKNSFFVLSSLSFSLAVYAYYGSRITAPLLILSLVFIYWKQFWQKKTNGVKFLAGFVILLPLFVAICNDPETLLGRVRYMSIFYDKNVWGQLWEASTFDGPNSPPLLTRFFHNKPFYYFKDILRRWLQHFELGFLFLKGEPIAPFQIPNMGLLYLVDLPFLLFGLFKLVKNSKPSFLFIILWLLLSPFVSSLTFMTPASNRSFNMIFPICLISSYGLAKFLETRKRFKGRWIGVIFTFYFALFTFYLYQYYYNIPFLIPDKWHYGRQELVKEIVNLQNNYQKVILTNKGGPPYIFLLFYQKYNPEVYWQTMRVNPYISELGWGHIDGFANYEILREFNWRDIKKQEGILYVSYEEEVTDIWQEPVDGKQLKVQLIKKIYYPNGKVAFKIFDLEEL